MESGFYIDSFIDPLSNALAALLPTSQKMDLNTPGHQKMTPTLLQETISRLLVCIPELPEIIFSFHFIWRASSSKLGFFPSLVGRLLDLSPSVVRFGSFAFYCFVFPFMWLEIATSISPALAPKGLTAVPVSQDRKFL